MMITIFCSRAKTRVRVCVLVPLLVLCAATTATAANATTEEQINSQLSDSGIGTVTIADGTYNLGAVLNTPTAGTSVVGTGTADTTVLVGADGERIINSTGAIGSLKNLTFTHDPDATPSVNAGGAVSVGSITGGIENVTFTNNQSKSGRITQSGNGSALYVSGNLAGGMKDTIFENNRTIHVYTAWIKGSLSGGLDNVTVKGNRVENRQPNGTSLQSGGGGIAIDKGLSGGVKNSLFEDNYSAQNVGGALAVVGTFSGDLYKTIFKENVGGEMGGGLHIWGTLDGSIVESEFTSNRLAFGENTNYVFYGGGAFFYGDMTGSIKDTTFTGNLAQMGGGLMTYGNIEGDIDNTTFHQNQAIDGAGGGMYLLVGMTGSITNSTFTENTARIGGAAYIKDHLREIRGGTFTGNTANQAGALSLEDLDATIDGTLFSGNQAEDYAGAIRATNATLELINPTFTNNTAGQRGGAIGSNSEVAIDVTAGSTGIFRGNTAAGTANDIHFNGAGSMVATVAATGVLDMQGGMNGPVDAGETVAITKTGSGDWYLGGNNLFVVEDDTASVDWRVDGGTFHLYGANEERISGAAAPEAGSISMEGTGSAFTLGSGTTLSVGGANSIETAGAITFEADSVVTTTIAAGGSASLKLDDGDGRAELAGALRLDTGASGTFTLDAAFTSSGAGSVTRVGGGDLVLGRADVFEGVSSFRLTDGTMSTSYNQTFQQFDMAADTYYTAPTADLTMTNGALRGTVKARNFTQTGDGRVTVYKPMELSGILAVSGGVLDVHLVQDVPIVVADNVAFSNGGILNITGFTGEYDCDYTIAIKTNGVIAEGDKPSTFHVINVPEPNCKFLTFVPGYGPDGKSIYIAPKLNWYNDENGSKEADGRFGIQTEDGYFDLDVVLLDRGNDVNASTNDNNWNGTNLIKGGPGTLALSRANEYKGGTIIEEGTLIVKNKQALGTGGLTFDPATRFSTKDRSLVLQFDGELANTIKGRGDIEIKGDVIYNQSLNDHNGIVAISEGSLTTDQAQTFSTLNMEASTDLTAADTVSVADGYINGSVTTSGDFVKTGDKKLAINGTVNVTRDFIVNGGGLDLNVGGPLPVITAGGDVNFNNNSFNISGFSGEVDMESRIVAGAIKNFDYNYTVAGRAPSDDGFLQTKLDQKADGLYITTGLAWTSQYKDPDNNFSRAHGNFDIADGENFELATSLSSRADESDYLVGGWDGNTMNKTGGGTLILAAENYFGGGINVDGGTVHATVAGALGECTVNLNGEDTTLRLEHHGELENGASGNGKVFVKGEQTWTGDWSGYNGDITLERGWIMLGTRTGGGITTDGNFTLNDNTYLMGSGSIGSLTMGKGSRLSIGYSIGTLNVDGDMEFADGSYYLVEVNPENTDENDLLRITGTATLNGATVVHRGLGTQDQYSTLGEWTILTADGGVIGRFNPDVRPSSATEETQAYAMLEHTLVYPDANNVILRVERNDRLFTDFAGTANQMAVAQALEDLGGGSDLFNRVIGAGGASELTSLYDQLSGEIHPTLRRMLLGYDRAFATSLLNRSGRGGAAEGDFPVWVEAQGYTDRLGGDGNAARSTLEGMRTSVGVEKRFLGGWLVGGAFQYGSTNMKVKSLSSKADVDSFNFGVYAGREWGMDAGTLRFAAGAGYGYHDIDSRRSVSSSVLNETLKAGYHAQTAQVFGDIGFAVDLPAGFEVEPYLRLGWNSAWTRGFTENGGVAALSARREHQGNLSQTVGVRAAWAIRDDATLHAGAGWVHTYGRKDSATGFAFVDGGAGMSVGGVRVPANAAVVNAGMSVAVNARTQVHFGYDGQFGSRSQNHAASLSVQIGF